MLDYDHPPARRTARGAARHGHPLWSLVARLGGRRGGCLAAAGARARGFQRHRRLRAGGDRAAPDRRPAYAVRADRAAAPGGDGAGRGAAGRGQLAFDAGGRVMAADPERKLLAFTPEPGPAPGRRLQCFPM
jgi:hypothetical protein